MTAEQVARYDPDDPVGVVTGSAPRPLVRSHNLPHAATAVLVRRSDGRLLVHRRSAAKDLWPAAHDAACGGLVLAGETPLDAACRELAEEVGIRLPPGDLRPVLTSWYRDEDTHYLAHVYETVWDGEVHHADGEVEWSSWWSQERLLTALADPTWPFVADTRHLLRLIVPAPVADPGPWPVGTTVLYRFGRFGRATFVRPASVVHDGVDELVLWLAAGTQTVRQVHADGRELRDASVPQRAHGPRVRRTGRWRDQGIYVRIPAAGPGWSLWHFFDADGSFRGWYGNLEAPQVRRRTAHGTLLVDTADRALDVWVPLVEGRPHPQWKDEDEFAAFTGAPGRWGADLVPDIRSAGQRLVDLALAASAPFDGRWCVVPDPLPAPRDLPVDWDLPHVAGP